MVGDVQHIEAKNSILRVMSMRSRRIRRDLMSSRHVIKSSAADLVPIECYTKSFRKQCKKASTSDSFEKRYKDVPVVDAEPPAELAKYKCPPERLPTVARLVAVIRKSTELFNVIMITVVADSSG